MTDSSPINPAAVKRRQYLLLAGIAAAIIGAALLSVSLTGPRDSGERAVKPKSTQILAPGGQVDPRDAWRGQADAQLKGIEQKSHELTQRNTELEGQNKQMLERLKKLEQTGILPKHLITRRKRDAPAVIVDGGCLQTHAIFSKTASPTLAGKGASQGLKICKASCRKWHWDVPEVADDARRAFAFTSEKGLVSGGDRAC